MVSRLELIRDVFRPWWAKLLAVLPVAAGLYQFGCDQFGFPKLPKLWHMTALPWWAWLFFAQTGVLFGLFEYVRRLPTEQAPAAVATTHQALAHPSPEEIAKDRALADLHKARQSARIAAYQGSDDQRSRAYHEMDSAMLEIQKHFGVAPLRLANDISDHLPYKLILENYTRYVDRFYPHLCKDQIEEARAKAASFNSSWGKQGI